jgi:hypothetical protein
MMFPTCFALISGIFHKVPIYLVFISEEQKTLFCVFSLRNFPGVKRTQFFQGFLSGIQAAGEEVD